jgi:cell division protein FtsA
MDEVLSLASDQIDRSGFRDRLGGGVVLTGGGASLSGITDLAERIFAAPVRAGVPGDGLAGLVDSVRRPKFATPTGLAVFGARTVASEGDTGGGRTVDGVVKKLRAWLEDFF